MTPDSQATPAPGWPSRAPAERRARPMAVLLMVLVIAAAGLVYELVIAAVASYVLGDSVTQFATVIGVYLSALGLGAYLSRFVRNRLNVTFVDVELATALFGGSSALLVFLAFAYTAAFHLVLYATVVVVGALVGLELPLLIRILKGAYELDELIARSLSVDYAGALAGSLAFSFLLVPRLGLIQSALLCGLLNALVGLASTWVLAPSDAREASGLRAARVRALIVTLLLAGGLGSGELLARWVESALVPGHVVLTEQSPYQRILLADSEGGTQLYLNGALQFDSRDEHRYHEALVHPAMATARARRRVLIGGGGDGLAAREALRWPDVEQLVLVDLDAAMTDLARDNPRLRALNQGALGDPRLTIVTADAMRWIDSARDTFDVIVLDFPDPSNYSVGKLFSVPFYASVRDRLAPGGALSVQSTSPLFARSAFWCIVHTLQEAGFVVRPYHVFVPSFGEWGFALAGREPFALPGSPGVTGPRFLAPDTLRAAFQFGPDMQELPTETNRPDNQALVAYYVSAWSRWN